MLKKMAEMKTFNYNELLDLLDRCASALAMAYQQTMDKELNWVSEEAFDACSYLQYEIEKQQPNRVIH